MCEPWIKTLNVDTLIKMEYRLKNNNDYKTLLCTKRGKTYTSKDVRPKRKQTPVNMSFSNDLSYASLESLPIPVHNYKHKCDTSSQVF